MQTGGLVTAVWICCRDVVTSLGLVITSSHDAEASSVFLYIIIIAI